MFSLSYATLLCYINYYINKYRNATKSFNVQPFFYLTGFNVSNKHYIDFKKDFFKI